MSNFLFFIILFLANPLRAFTVVIDPGHGGIDPGASRGSFVEDRIVFEIAKKIQQSFKDHAEIKIFLTRTLNSGLSLEDRVRFAAEKKADLFISLHANSSTSALVNGMEYYFSAKQPASVLLRTSAKTSSNEIKLVGIINTIKKDLIEFGKIKKSWTSVKKFKIKPWFF